MTKSEELLAKRKTQAAASQQPETTQTTIPKSQALMEQRRQNVLNKHAVTSQIGHNYTNQKKAITDANTYFNHGAMSQGGHYYADQRQKAYDTMVTKPMTTYIQNGGTIDVNDTSSMAQLAREQGTPESEIAYLQGKQQASTLPSKQTIYKTAPGGTAPIQLPNSGYDPVKTYDIQYGTKEAQNIINNLDLTKKGRDASKYVDALNNLEDARAKGNWREIAKNQAIIDEYTKKYKEEYNKNARFNTDILTQRPYQLGQTIGETGNLPALKVNEEWDKVQNMSINSLQKQLSGALEDLNKAAEKMQTSIGSNYTRAAEEYKEAYKRYQEVKGKYDEAVTYDTLINGRPVNDFVRGFGVGATGAVAKGMTYGKLLEDATLDFFGSARNPANISAKSLLNYNNKNYERDKYSGAIERETGDTDVTGEYTNMSPQEAFRRLKQLATNNPEYRGLQTLLNEISTHSYKGTEEELAKELDTISREMYQGWKNTHTQAGFDWEESQQQHNERVYKNPLLKSIVNSSITVGEMLPTAAAGLVGQPASMGTMFMSAAGGAADQAINQGATINQGTAYGALSGATEVGTETIGGDNVNRFLGMKGKSMLSKVFGDAIDNLHIDSKAAKVALKYMLGVGGEMLEEGVSEAVNPLLQMVTYDSFAMPDNVGEYFKNIFNAAVEAIPSTVLMSAMGAGGKVVQVNRAENTIIQQINSSPLLQADAKARLIEEVRRAANDVKLGITEESGSYKQDIYRNMDMTKAFPNNTSEKVTEPQQNSVEKVAQNNEQKEVPNLQGLTTRERIQAMQNMDVADQVKYYEKTAQKTLPQETQNALQFLKNNRQGLNIVLSDVAIKADGTLKRVQGNGAYVENADGTRTAYINPNATDRAAEFTVIHELAHDLKAGDAETYNKLKNQVINYAQKMPKYKDSLQALDETYKNAKVKYTLTDEATNDILAEALGDDEFIYTLADKQPNLLQKIYNWLKNVLMDGNNTDLTFNQRRMLNKMEQGFRKAYQKEYSNINNNQEQFFSLIGRDKYNNPIYKSNYGDEVTRKEKFEGLFKALEKMKGKPIRFLVNGRRIMASFDGYGVEKTSYGTTTGERAETANGMYAKINLANDLYEIISQSKFIGDSDEPSNVSNVPPKNAAHAGVRKWYTFKNTINYEGELYDVLTTVREKDSGNYTYSVKFFERNKKNNLSQAYDSKSLRDNTRPSYSSNSVAQTQHNVNDMQNSLSEAENTDKTLVATHNLTRDKLKGILELGGFPVPSIAISDVNKLTPTQFGDITVLFDKDTIDPTNKSNEVYDRDVWSPTFPQVDYDINNADIKKYITKGLNLDHSDGIISRAVTRYLYEDNLNDKVNRSGINGTLTEIKNSPEMKYLYKKAVEQGEYAPKTKETKYSLYHPNSTLKRFIDIYNKNHDMPLSDFVYHYINYGDMQMTETQEQEIKREIQEALRPELEEYYSKYFKDREVDNKLRKLIEDRIQEELNNEVEVLGKYTDFLFNSSTYSKEGESVRVDEDATLEDIPNQINQQEYEKWVDDTFGKLLNNAERGIRNDKDKYTNNGRRTFKQLHNPYNLQNIVKEMIKGQTKGGEGSIFGPGFGNTQAMAANRFNSIEDIRAAKDRLTTSEEANQKLEPIKEELSDDLQELTQYAKNTDSWWGIGMGAFDRVADAVTEFAGRKKHDIPTLKSTLKKQGNIDVDSIPRNLLQQTVDTIKKLENIETDYFEAKPQRAVGLEEVASILIPNDLPAEQKQALTDRGIQYTEYDPNIEGDREAKYKKAAQDVLFSKTNGTWQQFLDDNFGNFHKNGTKGYFETLPSNEELQQAETEKIEKSSEALRKPAEYDNDNMAFSLSEEQQKEVSDYVDKIYADNTLDEQFRDKIVNRLNSVDNYSKFEGIKQEVKDYKDKIYKGISSLTDIANMTENDVKMRPMEYTQRKDKNTSKQRKFFDNAETSQIIADETKKNYNATTYEQKANLDTLEEMRQKLDERGNDLIDEWKSKQKNFTSKDVALGAILVERYQQNGDWNSAARVVEKLADMGTEAGRAVQMYSIFQRLTPETMELYMQKTLDKAYEEMKQRKTGKWVEANKDKYKLDGDDIQFIYEQVEKASQAVDEETKQRELSKIENRINDKLPPEDGQTIKALRRMAMLFNPKTQIRNLAGNSLIMPVNDVADFIGSKIDKLVSKKTGVRTTANPNFKAKAQGFKKGIKAAITDYKTGTRTAAAGSKYEFDIGAKAFNENTDNKVLNAINRKLNGINDLLSAVMSGGDRPFYEAAYKNSLEGQMKANNVTEPTQDMIDIAVNEALQRTWNDDNEYTKTVLGIRRAMNRINVHGFGLGDLIIPFAKTPANLTKAMVEYSPVGFLEAAYDFNDMRKAISRGEMTPAQQKRFVNSTSKAITGTMLYMIAGMLAKSGALTGSADDDKDVKNFEQNVLGIQPYSVKVKDKTYTYSWANPINAPLAIMADTYKMSKENASKWDMLKNAFKVAGETLVDNSFLQGIKELFSKDSISEGIVDAIESFPEQLIPTFMSQLASLGDKKQRQTFEYQDDFKTISNKIKNKLPGARNTLEPQVNTFGEEIENQNTAFNAFINPANVREARITDEQKALYDVYQETKDKTIFPMQAPYYTNNDAGEKQNLSTSDRVTYQKASGQYVNDIYKDLFNSSDFENLSNEGKVKVLHEIATDGNLKGREAVGAVKTSTNSNLSRLNDNIDELKQADIPLADYYLSWYAKNNLAQGKTHAAQKKAIRDNTDLTTEQEEVLYGIFNIK